MRARNPRQQPDRTLEQARQRLAICKRWGEKPKTSFKDTVDMILDNEKFDVPTTERAKRYLRKQPARFHLRGLLGS